MVSGDVFIDRGIDFHHAIVFYDLASEINLKYRDTSPLKVKDNKQKQCECARLDTKGTISICKSIDIRVWGV